MPFFLNPKRRRSADVRERIMRAVKWPFTAIGLACGFPNLEYSYVHGDPRRLTLGERVSTVNTLFNTNGGTITVGDDVVFGHDCAVITGRHEFYRGRRASLQPGAPGPESPSEGNDVVIGQGCFIGSRALILGGVTIGHDSIIGAGAVVTRDVPPSSFAAGVPARVVSRHDATDREG